MSSRLHSLIKYTTLSKNIKIKIAFKRSIIYTTLSKNIKIKIAFKRSIIAKADTAIEYFISFR